MLLSKTDYISYPYFKVPQIFFDPEIPTDWKREFMRGDADVAGNIRHANRFVDGQQLTLDFVDDTQE